MTYEEEPKCGDRGCKCSLAWRGACCFVVIISAIMVAYSVGDSRHAINSCWLKSNCLYFGDVSKHTTDCRDEHAHALPTGGPSQLCDFSLLAAVIQMVLAAIFALTVVVKTCCTRRASNSTAFAVLELVFGCVCGITAIITGIVMTAGTEAFTSKLLHHWNETYGAFPTAVQPKSHQGAYILNNLNATNGEPLHYYETLLVGIVGSWMGAVAWTVYVIIAAVSCHRWQRPKKSSEKAVGKFSRFRNNDE